MRPVAISNTLHTAGDANTNGKGGVCHPAIHEKRAIRAVEALRGKYARQKRLHNAPAEENSVGRLDQNRRNGRRRTSRVRERI